MAAACSLVPTQGSESQPSSAASLIAQADIRQLAERPEWLALLHMRPGWGGHRSLIDSPAFFLAPDGKTNPRAELHATLRAILMPPGDAPATHAGCRFPARQAWLAEQLAIPDDALGMPRCAELEAVLAQMAPQGVSLVYPAAYMNSPASLFGHTLLSIRSEHDSDLLNHAVNYAAKTAETNGIVFAFKGIFGFYPGYYSVMPYYRLVRQYNDMSQRDMWEYRLDFTPAEARRLVLHVWELRDIHSDYYFFDENCSYMLLFLLDVARPGLDLAGRSRAWVIPLDTVRLADRAGLVSEVVYRPSRATQIRHVQAQLTRPERRLARQVSQGKVGVDDESVLPAEPARRALVLDLASEDLQSRYERGGMTREAYVPAFRRLLIARSRLQPPADYLPPIDTSADPRRGHASSRLTLGFGAEDGRGYGEIALRPAYHDLLDPDDGYLAGSEIQFLETIFRVDNDDRLTLHHLELLRIVSLSPRDTFYRPISWKIAAGFIREPDGDGEVHRQAYLNTGGGYAWDFPQLGLTYLLAESELRVGDIPANYAFGFGLSAGVLRPLTDRWKLHAGLRATRFVAGDEYGRYEAWLDQRFTLTPNLALIAELAWRRLADDDEALLRGALAVYF